MALPLSAALPPRASRLTASLGVRAAYFSANAAVLTVLYARPASALFVRGSGGAATDVGVEALLWSSVVASWAAFLALQGSAPGYIEVSAASAAAAAAADEPPAAPSTRDNVHLLVQPPPQRVPMPTSKPAAAT